MKNPFTPTFVVPDSTLHVFGNEKFSLSNRYFWNCAPEKSYLIRNEDWSSNTLQDEGKKNQ